MVFHGVRLPEDEIAALCRRHHIRKLSLIGSILSDKFRPESDVDVLVEFEPGKTPGLDFYGIEIEMSNLLGRPVDLNTRKSLGRDFRDQVLAEARTLYAQE